MKSHHFIPIFLVVILGLIFEVEADNKRRGNKKNICRDSKGVKYKIGTGPEPKNCLQKICKRVNKKMKWVSKVSDDCACIVNDGTWDYGNTKGPSMWATLFPDFCGGRSQSPINIVSSAAVPTDTGSIAFSGYDTKKEAEIVNNGHSVSLSFKDQNVPTITGGRLPAGDTFEFLSVHWHWGSSPTQGSEHTLDGRQFPLEIHVIHWNAKYHNFSNALDKTDGLAVLGFFYEISEEGNPHLQPVVDKLGEITKAKKSKDVIGGRFLTAKQSLMNYYVGNKGNKRSKDDEDDGNDSAVQLDQPVSLDQLLPPQEMRKEYFYYSGSLTTPSCNEIVLWTVFKKHLDISEDQLEKFRSLMSGHKPIVDNYRPPQPLNGRIVEVSSISAVTPTAPGSSPGATTTGPCMTGSSPGATTTGPCMTGSSPGASTTGPCMTVSGAQVGVRCVFPFTARETTYSTCTIAGGYSTPWCATKVDQSGKIILGNWGECPTDDPNCPNDITTEAPTK